MREILFRGKSVVHGEWLQGDLSHWVGRDEIETFIRPIDVEAGTLVYPASVGQYTGKEDKYGTLIYEGDIIKFDLFPGAQCIGVVEWSEKDCMFFMRIGERNGTSVYSSGQVIGNIHDNPELFEEAET